MTIWECHEVKCAECGRKPCLCDEDEVLRVSWFFETLPRLLREYKEKYGEYPVAAWN